MKLRKKVIAALVPSILCIIGGTTVKTDLVTDVLDVVTSFSKKEVQLPNTNNLNEIAEYDGKNPVVTVNDNRPSFVEEDLVISQEEPQEFSDLDHLNRVGAATVMLSQELFPGEERENLTIKPTGWKQKKIEGNKWLYNRSHLIAHRLTGENNNIRNLFTGTNQMNQIYMKKYETEIAEYIKNTGHHVRYKVTPYFKSDELVCRGVNLEAQSIEDDTISFNVFIYNVQDGYDINYKNGQSSKQ